ncbi:MAG TPA: gluconate 2-dehydrogenase subunit 3 family protein [Vicinamibacteria bacterium]|nr:gluconate 2-dehydrogenase subunit 3 family protein [Vicinamibacteria bacterium]
MSGKGIDRREMLRRSGALPLAGLLSPQALRSAHEHVGRQKAAAREGPYQPTFFTAQEWPAVQLLADAVLPADDRSPGASQAGVPEFIDFVLTDPLADPKERETLQTQVRGGLAWLDRECAGRFGRSFVDATEKERAAVLDAIAFPARVAAGLEAGAAFFATFRDLVASGFWTSRVGIDDLQYRGNTYVAEWKGCPPEVLSRLGLEER